MVTAWRRAFCTSIRKDGEPKIATDEQKHQKQPLQDGSCGNPSPSFGYKFSFFKSSSGSNPSTPCQQSPPASSLILGCQAAETAASTLASPREGSPSLRCKTEKSPGIFQCSNPSSPRSPSTFSLLKNSLRFTKSRCGICIQRVKTGQGTSIFTAECSHAFHFPCLVVHIGKYGGLACPVCGSSWKESPLFPVRRNPQLQSEQDNKFFVKESASCDVRIYNDDEPLMSPTTGARFNPIPESDENDEDNETETAAAEFQGFAINNSTPRSKERNESSSYKDVELRISVGTAVIPVGRGHETYAVVMRVKAPPAPANTALHASIDLVTVLDVGGSMTSSKLEQMKRAMRLVISSLSSNDRLCVVAFSACSKRLLPLRRMTISGKRSARRIIGALVCSQGTCVNDALRKAAKVINDRRERNPVARIMLLSDGGDDRISSGSACLKHKTPLVSSTRFSHLDIPVHSFSLGAFSQQPCEEAFSGFFSCLLNVVVSDLRLQISFASGSAPAQISAVYSCTGRPGLLSSGSAKLGDLHAEEEREILLELKVPSSSIGPHHVLSVRSCYKSPSNQELIYGQEQGLMVPRPDGIRSSDPSIQRLRRLFIMTRAVAESRRLLGRNDLSGAHYLLESARALLLQSGSESANEWLGGVEAEIEKLHCRRQSQPQQRRTTTGRDREMRPAEGKEEPLTPTSAWKAAERLAKVAIIRKSMNRVSDLHGFENARF
ncbi:hypothetical protein Nepgr_016537 [Nepenthes gracilis]|uniref:Uncharacterized protein n=1 Tax=Nepenthes gracilis TaxID=150966 RepID=A0AAD3SQI2_NEPGR|nr:hypothetical protein Nepgr_016537 [Nepenthes gracilis]